MEKLTEYFNSFEDSLHQHIEETFEESDFEKHLELLSKSANPIVKKIIDLGDFAFEQSQNDSKTTTLPYLNVNFSWAGHAKSFLILWRNILFEHQKAHLFYLDNELGESIWKKLHGKSYLTLVNTRQELMAFFEKEIKAAKADKKSEQKQIQKWRAQKNPWPILKTQLSELAKQCQNLKSSHNKLVSGAKQFLEINELILDNISNCKTEVQQAKTLAEKTTDFILDNFGEKTGKIAPHLEDLEANIKNVPHLSFFKTRLNNFIKELSNKQQVPVNTASGLIQTREINFQKTASNWLESEMLPLLYEIWELTEVVSNGIKMSILNIRNRSILLTTDIKSGGKSNVTANDLTQPLEAFWKKADNWEANLLKFEQIIKERLSEEFMISGVYDLEREFLPVTLESTLTQFKLDRNEWVDMVKKWLIQKWSFVRRFQRTVQQEEALSISEKVVRYVKSRTVEPHNNQYTSIFLTKGFIGESFWVGRSQELKHAKHLIQEWRSGFRGAVILSGQRLSGKSLFGDLVANRYFSNNTIKLVPLSTLDVGGRKFTCEYDLKPALDFILKYTQHKNPMIWLDDLELWQSPTIRLAKNVRVLQKFIDDHSRKMFFMVSMSNWLKAHLNKVYEFNYAFQAEINMDKMSIDEIKDAILIRHGATHKTLVDESGNKPSPKDFQKMIAKIHKTSEGNIGEALNQWSYSTRKEDEDKVVYEGELRYSLPDFSGASTSILLAAIMMEKRTNEFRLSKLFGPPYREKYHPILQRLISNGLLTRHLDGWLEVTEGAVNDIGRVLERKKYLKFH